MPSAPHAPAAPSTSSIINSQTQANTAALGQNTMNQSNPYGNLTYTTSVDPITGQLKYQANQNYSQAQQGLLNTTQQTGQTQGNTGLNLAENMAGLYSQAPNFNQGADSLTSQAEAPVQAAYERFFTPARSQLDTQLRNQGIMPGTPAYQQQTDALTQQQNLTEGSWLANFQPQAFNEAMQGYQAPENMIGSLFGMGQPTSLQGTWSNTPQVNAANANQAAQTSLGQQNFDYQQKVAQQNNMMGGLFGIGGKLGSAAILA